jgi:hypothetical protein
MLFILAIGGLLSSGRISLNTHERPHDTETVPKRERKRERERERERGLQIQETLADALSAELGRNVFATRTGLL